MVFSGKQKIVADGRAEKMYPEHRENFPLSRSPSFGLGRCGWMFPRVD